MSASGRYAASNNPMMIEKISAVTLLVANMEASVCFYKDVLGLEVVYGGKRSHFTSHPLRPQRKKRIEDVCGRTIGKSIDEVGSATMFARDLFHRKGDAY